MTELIEDEQATQGLTLAQTSHVARLIVALMNGIGIMRALNPDAVDDAFLETTMAFLARALVPTSTPTAP